jgi:transcriptional regulator with XRE-family HTH domain
VGSRSARRRYCRCGALLAADNAERQCARCQRASRDKYVVPPQVPSEFWHTELLREAFAAQHMGRVSRAYRLHPYHHAVYGPDGITQKLLGQWLGLQQSQISRIETGPPIRDLGTLVYWARVLRIPAGALWFDLPGETRQTAPSELESPPDPDTLTVDGLTRSTTEYIKAAGELPPRVVRALEVTRHAAVSELTALRDLNTVIEHYKQTFRITPSSEFYNEILGVRVHVGTLLDGTRVANNHSDLMVAAGWLSNLLALVTHELCDRAASLVWCADAERYSREAHYPELGGWAAQTRVLMSFYDGQAREAVTHAQQGQQIAPLGTVAHAKLVVQEMRAWALIGNSDEVSSTRWRAEKAIAKLPSDTPTRGAFSISLADDPPYTATSLLLLGQYKEAEKATRRVIATFYGSSASEGRREHPSGFARTHLILALALAGLGKLDEAYIAGSLALEAPRLNWPVAVLAGKLDQALMRDFTDTTEACAYHERYVATMQQNSSVGGLPTLFGTSFS